MDLELTDEQVLLSESVAGLLSSSTDHAWSALTEFGVAAMASGAEADVGPVEIALVGRELGKRLAATPFVDTAAALFALRGLGPESAPFDEIRASGGGLALALLEAGGSWELESVATTIDDGIVRGSKSAVQHAGAVDHFLVLCEDRGARRLAVVGSDASGVRVDPIAEIDDSLGSAAVTFTEVRVSPDAVLSAEESVVALETLMAIGAVAAASEAVGAAAEVLELARQYAGERKQFGQTIGSFQALRHILADMYVRQDSSWSTVLFAAASLGDDSEDALRTASIAKAWVARATLQVAHDALQVFGGVAFTAEHPAHLFLRRIVARGYQFGDARFHERSIGRTLVGDQKRLVASA